MWKKWGGGSIQQNVMNCPYSPQIKHGTVRCVSDGYETSVIHNISCHWHPTCARAIHSRVRGLEHFPFSVKKFFLFTFSCFSSVQNSPPRHWQQALLNRQVKLRWHSDHQVLPRGIWISDPPACICLLCLESQAKITSAELTGQFFTCSRISRHLSA